MGVPIFGTYQSPMLKHVDESAWIAVHVRVHEGVEPLSYDNIDENALPQGGVDADGHFCQAKWGSDDGTNS